MTATATGTGDINIDDVALPIPQTTQVLESAFLAAGLRADEATLIVDALMQAELCEVRSHGVLRVAWYLSSLQNGAFNVAADITADRRRPGITLIDGDGALGYLPTWTAVESAAHDAKLQGMAIAGVRRIGEFGRAAYYAEGLASRGFVGIVCQNTPPLIGAPGSRRATHGNNPLAYAAPWHDAPLFDAAFSPRSSGELKRRALLGLTIPAEWGYVDAASQPITDPDTAFNSVMPPVGGAKGFGLSVLVDLLAGMLTGAATGPDVRFGAPEVGAIVLALDPDLFGHHHTIAAKSTAGATSVRATGGRWPGDRTHQARRTNLARGWIEVPRPIVDEMQHAIDHIRPGLELEHL